MNKEYTKLSSTILDELREISKDKVIITATQPNRSNDNYDLFIPVEKDDFIFIDYIGLL